MTVPPKTRLCRVRRYPRHLFPSVSRAHVYLYLSFSTNTVTQSITAARAAQRLVTSFTRPTQNGQSCWPMVLLRLPTQTVTGDPPLEARLDAPRLRHRPLTTNVKEGGHSQTNTSAAPPNPASDEKERRLVGAVRIIVSAVPSCLRGVPVEMTARPVAPALPTSLATVRLFFAFHLNYLSLTLPIKTANRTLLQRAFLNHRYLLANARPGRRKR